MMTRLKLLQNSAIVGKLVRVRTAESMMMMMMNLKTMREMEMADIKTIEKEQDRQRERVS